MKLTLAVLASLAVSCQGFAPQTRLVMGHARSMEEPARREVTTIHSAVVEDAPAAPEKEAAAPMDPPTAAELKSETGADFLPLATALMAKEWKEADALTRELLIFIAGPGARSRKFVYFTEVPRIPAVDLATLETLWLKYSGGKFGYSVQKFAWASAHKVDRGGQEGFEAFCRKIGWSLVDDDLERKRRWFGTDEFIYDLEDAPKGHLPLTSALRGTSLLKALYAHPVWNEEPFASSGKGKYDK